MRRTYIEVVKVGVILKNDLSVRKILWAVDLIYGRLRTFYGRSISDLVASKHFMVASLIMGGY